MRAHTGIPDLGQLSGDTSSFGVSWSSVACACLLHGTCLWSPVNVRGALAPQLACPVAELVTPGRCWR